MALSLSLLSLWTSPSVEQERLQKEMMQNRNNYRSTYGAIDQASEQHFGNRRLSAGARMRGANRMMLMNNHAMSITEMESHLSNPLLPPHAVEIKTSAHSSIPKPEEDHAGTTPARLMTGVTLPLASQSLGNMELSMPNVVSSVATSPVQSTSTSKTTEKPVNQTQGFVARAAFVAVCATLGAFLLKRQLRASYVRKRESMPLLYDDDDDSYSITYTSSPSEAGYGSIVSSSWTDDFDKFDL